MPIPLLLALIPAIASVITAGAGVAQQAIAANALKSDCEKNCKDKCKAEHGALFSGRQKCIKACAAECAAQANLPPPPPPEPETNWWYIVAGILAAVAILLFIFRKRLAK